MVCPAHIHMLQRHVLEDVPEPNNEPNHLAWYNQRADVEGYLHSAICRQQGPDGSKEYKLEQHRQRAQGYLRQACAILRNGCRGHKRQDAQGTRHDFAAAASTRWLPSSCG
jgi:hypothetical protein